MLKVATLMLALCCGPCRHWRAREHRGGTSRGLGALARRQFRHRPGLFAARCTQFHELLQRLPCAQYVRYQRMADDLKIPTAVLENDLLAPGSHSLDYISTALPASDAVAWFGKVPPIYL